MKRAKLTGNASIDMAIRDTVRDLPRVVDVGRIDVVTAGEAFVVDHTLREVPDFFVANPWSDFNVFADENMQQQWSAYDITLCASAAGTFTLKVGKH